MKNDELTICKAHVLVSVEGIWLRCSRSRKAIGSQAPLNSRLFQVAHCGGCASGTAQEEQTNGSEDEVGKDRESEGDESSQCDEREPPISTR